MSTLDRLRELARGTGRQTPSATPSSPAVTGVTPAVAHELTYEAVDDVGLPMPVRDEVPDLPGAALCETPLGRCVVVERVFERDAPYGQLRVEDGRVSVQDVKGFCAAQLFSAEDPLWADEAGVSGAGISVPGLSGPGVSGLGASAPGLLPRAYQLDLSQFVDPPFERFDKQVGRRSGKRFDDQIGGPIDGPLAGRFEGRLRERHDHLNDHRHDHRSDGVSPDILETTGLDGPVMFLDLETTGLSGGAGTVAFLVGCGFFDGSGAFRTRQFLLPGFAAERALLHAVTSCLAEAGCLVTYNGRTFDLPLMETRWMFHRQPVAWGDLTHLDMLHVSRRLWRSRGDEDDAGCRLVELERDLFGVTRVGDVGGWEIPGRYFEYIRHGNAALLEPVLHHNRLDLLSLALVTARAIRLLRDGLEASRDPREWLAIGRELLRLQQRTRAEACFRAVVDSSFAPDAVRGEALYTWARLLRRARRFQEAADLWRQLVGCRAARAVLRAEAQEALAVHHEHRDRNLDVAHRWAKDALDARTNPTQRDAVAHRLARLRRKMGSQGDGPISGQAGRAGAHQGGRAGGQGGQGGPRKTSVQTKGGPKTAFDLPLMTMACD